MLKIKRGLILGGLLLLMLVTGSAMHSSWVTMIKRKYKEIQGCFF